MDKIETKNTLVGLTIRFIKEYRKNTFALIFSISLTITLIFSMLTLLHTNHRITAKQNLFIYTAIDYEIRDLDSTQANQLKQNTEIQHLGFAKNLGNIQTKDSQRGVLRASNTDDMLAVAKLLKGRMPKDQQEIVAEKWALLNLGINPVIGQDVTIPISYSHSPNSISTENFKLVGVISDQAFNKRAAAITLYTHLNTNKTKEKDLIATVTFAKNNKQQKMTKIKKQLSLNNKQVRQNVWQEDIGKLLLLDCQMGLLLIIICSIVIYGIHRIALLVRKDQFGILRALGLTKVQIKKMILLELSGLTLFSLPVGIVAGFLSSYLITLLSKDQSIRIYFWGRADRFDLIVPIIPIVICLVFFFLAILLVGNVGANTVNAGSVTEAIFGEENDDSSTVTFLQLNEKPSKLKIYQQLGLKYVFREIKTSLFIVLSLVLASTLFIGLFYQAILAKETQEIKLATSFYNSDYLLTTYDDLDPLVGIKPNTLKSIKKITSVKDLETQSALPIKVVDSGVARNERYLKEKGNSVLRKYGFALTGKLNNQAVYHTKLKGYNSNALKKLKNYLKAGDFEPDNLAENEVIIAMPTTSTYGKSKGAVGYFKNGESLMDYQVGDELLVNYVADFDTISENYWKMDKDSNRYSQKKLKIAAIAYYPYMSEVSLLEQGYPLLIMSEQAYRKIVPDYTYETVNMNAAVGLSSHRQDLIEEQLIRLAVKNQQVTARSMIDEKEQLSSIYRKEIVYVFGIAFVVLVLVIINLINNLKYRIETRRQELYLLKALGLSYRELEKMIIFENAIFVVVSVIASVLTSIIGTKFQYQYAQIYLLGKVFEYPGLQVVGLSFCIFCICYLISLYLARGLRNSNIIEEFSKVD